MLCNFSVFSDQQVWKENTTSVKGNSSLDHLIFLHKYMSGWYFTKCIYRIHMCTLSWQMWRQMFCAVLFSSNFQTEPVFTPTPAGKRSRLLKYSLLQTAWDSVMKFSGAMRGQGERGRREIVNYAHWKISLPSEAKSLPVLSLSHMLSSVLYKTLSS